MGEGLTAAEEAVRLTAVECVGWIATRWPTTRTWREQRADTGEWVASKITRDYIEAVRHAAGEDIDAVGEGITAAMDAQEGPFPPTASDVARAVARAARRRAEADRERRNRERRAMAPAPNRYAWLGYLAQAATYAGWADRGEAHPCPPILAPYLEMVTEIGYRNHHGCGPWRDEDGNGHAGDPLHDPELYADAEKRARDIWVRAGMPAAPRAAALVGG